MIRCTTGTRLIKMIASPECITSCSKSFTVLLSAGKTCKYFNFFNFDLKLDKEINLCL